MAEGHIRGILWRHLQARHGQDPAAPDAPPSPLDANALLPATPFAAALQAVAELEGDDALRSLGRDYARLWARTFRRLVRHLRGRPDDMAALFAHEIWPHLRGDPLAARLDGPSVRLHDDLPRPYLEGMLAGFLELTGAGATVTTPSPGSLHYHARVPATLTLARLAQRFAAMRLPLVALALLAVLAATLPLDPAPRLLWIALGAAAAQVAANAVPDLRRGPEHLAIRPGRRAALAQVLAGAAVATGCLIVLTPAAPALPLFALLGAALGGAYGWLRDHGLGVPAMILYGPLVVTGAHYAATGAPSPWTPIVGLPIGLGGAAWLHLSDLADRPADTARGSRTLAVRIPTRLDPWVYGGLLVAAALVWLPSAPLLFGALILAAVGLALVVARHLDDPSRLAPVRLATMIYVALMALQGGLA